MESEASLLWGVLFGAIGMGFFVYGKKQRQIVPLITGVLLMLYTYFVPNPVAVVLVGIGIMAIPYFVRL